jgi:uncharacterized protein
MTSFMSRTLKATTMFASALTLCAAASVAQAQEPSAEHIAAARAAISALGATDEFDNILPGAAEQLKSTFIQATPNMEEEISSTVDEVAIELASRRADLEREAAAIYARNFTVEELNAIRDFYTSPAGTKLLSSGSTVTQELYRAAEIWSNGVSRDLATQAAEALDEQLGIDSTAPVGIAQ